MYNDGRFFLTPKQLRYVVEKKQKNHAFGGTTRPLAH
jgi:hypothetical protein